MKIKKFDDLIEENQRLAKALSILQEAYRLLKKENADLVQERNRHMISNLCLTNFYTDSLRILEDNQSSIQDKNEFVSAMSKAFDKCSEFLCFRDKTNLLITDLSYVDKIEKSRRSPKAKKNPRKSFKKFSESSQKQLLQPQGKSSLEVYDFPEDDPSSPILKPLKKRATIYRSSQNVSSDHSEHLGLPIMEESKNNPELVMKLDDMVITNDSIDSIRPNPMESSDHIFEDPEIPTAMDYSSIIDISIKSLANDSKDSVCLNETFVLNKTADEHSEKRENNKPTDPSDENKENTDNSESISSCSSILRDSSMISDMSSENNGRQRRSRSVVSYKLPNLSRKIRKGDTEWCRKGK